MQYIAVALAALAIGAEASPARHRPEGLAAHAAGSGVFPTGAFPTGVFPTGAFPTGASVVSAAPTGWSPRDRRSSSSKKSKTSSKTSSTATATTTSAPSKAAAAPGGGLPASSGSSAFSAVQTIAAGESFDGGMVMFDRGVSCTGQSEGGDGDAVFEIEDGGSLSNVIIGPNQIEGVHCFGSCTLTNVWWSAVCEDAFTIKEQDAGATTNIIGGGAFGAEDKVLQHNGAGTMSVSGFTVDGFGKLYRACGNCKSSYERHVIFDNISATDGKALAGINPNFGDTATFTNIVASDVDDICVSYQGTTPGNEPKKLGSGPSDACIYSDSDISSN